MSATMIEVARFKTPFMAAGLLDPRNVLRPLIMCCVGTQHINPEFRARRIYPQLDGYDLAARPV